MRGNRRVPVRATGGVSAHVWPDQWATKMRLEVDGHPFDVRGREYVVGIMRDESKHIIIPKGAQLGLTTTFLVRTGHWVVKRKWHHLYLLPLKTGATSFVQGRIDPILDSNPDLKALFKSIDNRNHKQTVANIAWRIRGTNIWNELREVPADVLVLDERDKMVEENLPEAEARLDGSKIARITELSTPTVPGHGVDSEESWGNSDQHAWYVRCPHCGRSQTFSLEENVALGDVAEDCFLRCSLCKKEITDSERGEINSTGFWQAEQPSGEFRGYHISQLNSPTKPMGALMKNYYAGQRNSRKMKAFYNNQLGKPYVALGDQFTADLLDKCIGKRHTLGGVPGSSLEIGVDVGTVLHMVANFRDGKKRVMWGARIFSGDRMWYELNDFLSKQSSFVCVIDAHPEKTMARELAMAHGGRVWVGFERDRPNQAEIADYKPTKWGEVPEVVIDRTMAFDSVIAEFINGNHILPVDAREIGENMPRLEYNGYYHHMMQQVRVEEFDANERLVARWKGNKNPDHWHHAEMFSFIASMKDPYVNITPALGEIFNQAGGLVAS